MLAWSEFARSVRGAWLLFRFEARGVYEFDTSLRGFWRSFWAPALMLPIDLLVLLPLTPAEGDATMILVGEAVGFALFFTLWPLLLIPISRSFHLTAHYVPYVVAYNWSSVISMAMLAPVALLVASGGGGGGVGAIATLGLLLVNFLYQFVIARMALQATLPIAVALVVLDYLLSIAIDYAMALLFG